MIVEAGPKDRAALEALLTARIDVAMFPLTNLRAHGLGDGGFASTHRHATRFWFVGGGIIAVTQDGMLMALIDAASDLGELPVTLAGMTLAGAVGPALSVRSVLEALGLSGLPARKDADEPGFALDLARLKVPNLPGTTLVPAAQAPRELLVAWRAAATVETQGMPVSEAPARAENDIDGWLANDTHRILRHDDRPVAMTGFNARLPEIAQVGGVYTPPALRNRGYARTAVALHLAEVRAHGCTRAVLFAATPAAARAYLAIGFQRTADFAMIVFRDPVTLPT